MQEIQQNGMDKLETRVEQLLEAYHALKRKVSDLEVENASLRNNSMTTRAQNEAISSQITKLEDDLSLKDLQADDISLKIEEIFRD